MVGVAKMSNQIVTIEDNVFSVIEQASGLVKNHNSISIDAEKNYAIQQLFKNKISTETAQRNPVSVQNAILNLSSIGISLNPALKHAYLVPRDGAICLDISYMGLMHLAQEIGSIEWGQAKIVYENDTYENQGLNNQPVHKYNAFTSRGNKVGVYCCVKLPSGDYLTEEMSGEDIAAVRKSSKSQHSSYSPWNTFEEEMWRKSAVKRASKYWPKSNNNTGNRLDTAIHVINEHEGLDNEREKHLEKLVELYEGNCEPLVLWGFMEKFRDNDILSQWLYSNFPKGHKGKIGAILKTGRDQFFNYKAIFEEDNDSEVEEAKAELSEIEIKIINKAIHERLIN
jgi:phage RecT family recombinase